MLIPLTLPRCTLDRLRLKGKLAASSGKNRRDHTTGFPRLRSLGPHAITVGVVTGRSVIGSAHGPQATERVRRLQAMEIPCCRPACASGRSSRPMGRESAICDTCTSGAPRQSGCRSGADALLENPFREYSAPIHEKGDKGRRAGKLDDRPRMPRGLGLRQPRGPSPSPGPRAELRQLNCRALSFCPEKKGARQRRHPGAKVGAYGGKCAHPNTNTGHFCVACWADCRQEIAGRRRLGVIDRTRIYGTIDLALGPPGG
jgi:hypothetical protein